MACPGFVKRKKSFEFLIFWNDHLWQIIPFRSMVTENMTAFDFVMDYTPDHHIICLRSSQLVKKKVKSAMKVIWRLSASTPPWFSTGPHVSFVPFQLSKPAEMKGAEGAAPRASTANGKCQPLSRARNHKQPRSVSTGVTGCLRRTWRASCCPRKNLCRP